MCPFLEALSYRLLELSEEFRVLLFQEWQLEPHVPHVPTPKEIARKKQGDFDFSKHMLQSVTKNYPEIEAELVAVFEKVKPAETKPESEEETDAQQPPDELKDFREALAGLAGDAEELNAFQKLYEVSVLDKKEYQVLKRIIDSIHLPLIAQWAEQHGKLSS